MADTATAEPTEGAVADRLSPSPPPSASALAGAALPTSREALTGLEASIRRGEESMAQTERALGSARDDQRLALENKAAVVNPLREKARGMSESLVASAAESPRPLAPFIPEPPSKGLRAFLAAPKEGEPPEASIAKLVQGLTLFASMVGGTRKGGAVAALASFTGAMKGWQEGDKERADRAFGDWRAKTDKLLQDHDLRTKDWDAWFTNSKLSVDQAMNGAAIAALEQGDIVAAKAFSTGSLEQALAHTDKVTSAANTIRAKMAEILSSRELSEAQMKAMEEYRHQALAQQERLRVAEIGSRNAIAQANLDARKEGRDAMPAPGMYFDRATGEPVNITRGELRDEPDKYRHATPQQLVQHSQIMIAKPMLKRLRGLTDKLLADQPGENLAKAIELSMQGKLAANPDLREFQAQVEDVNVKMTAVMSNGGQFRVTLMNILRGVGVTTRDTKATAQRLIDQWETNIDNDLAAITGGKMREHLPGPWKGWALSPTGEKKWIEIDKGERIEPGWITLEDAKK